MQPLTAKQILVVRSALCGAAALVATTLAALASLLFFSANALALEEFRRLPDSSIGFGKLQWDKVWLADPTGRYPHGVLGDTLEAGSLVATTRSGLTFQVTLPQNRVFEDLIPRVVDLDRDGLEEILVVESDRQQGASLAVYGTPFGPMRELVKLGATPFLGQPFRWLHPLGTGDFDGDGWLDIALVETPHIGGSLVLYRYQRGKLTEFARYFGVSTHETGSTELGMARIVRGTFRDHIVLPDQSLHRLLLLSWQPTGIMRIKDWKLPAKVSHIDPARDGRVMVVMKNGETLTLDLPRLQ